MMEGLILLSTEVRVGRGKTNSPPLNSIGSLRTIRYPIMCMVGNKIILLLELQAERMAGESHGKIGIRLLDVKALIWLLIRMIPKLFLEAVIKGSSIVGQDQLQYQNQ